MLSDLQAKIGSYIFTKVVSHRMSALSPAAHKSLTTLILSLREQLLPIAHTSISHTLGICMARRKILSFYGDSVFERIAYIVQLSESVIVYILCKYTVFTTEMCIFFGRVIQHLI